MLTIHAYNLLVLMIERDKEKIKDFLYVSFFMVIQIFIITEYLFSQKNGSDIFWFCNHVAIFYAYTAYKHRPQIAIGIMQVGILIQVLWLVGFVSHILGVESLGITQYMFEGSFDYAKVVTFLVHILLPISSLWLVRKEKPEFISLIYSILFGVFLYTATLLFTSRDQNVNCVFSPCASFLPQWGYTVLWPLYMGSVVLSTHVVYRLIFQLIHQKRGRVRTLYPAAP